MTPTDDAHVPECVRPRIEGEREGELLDACVEELLENGYDRLTMDAVAKRARASKATLYRRWQTKQALAVDAVIRSKQIDHMPVPDTGSLRGDLLALHSGTAPHSNTQVLGVMITAMQTDPEFAEEFRRRFLRPKIATSVEIYRRAAERGELLPDADPELLGPALAGILLHRSFLLGEVVTPALVERVLDQIILPAATGRLPQHSPDPQNLQETS